MNIEQTENAIEVMQAYIDGETIVNKLRQNGSKFYHLQKGEKPKCNWAAWEYEVEFDERRRLIKELEYNYDLSDSKLIMEVVDYLESLE